MSSRIVALLFVASLLPARSGFAGIEDELPVPRALGEAGDCPGEIAWPREARQVRFSWPAGAERPRLPLARGLGQRWCEELDEAVVLEVRSAQGTPACTPADIEAVLDPEILSMIESDPWIRVEPELRQFARSAAGSSEDLAEQARRLARWVHEKIELSPPRAGCRRASDVLAHGSGSALERTVLFAAMCRCLRIPARPVLGLLWVDGRLLPTAWAELWTGAWWSLDTTQPDQPIDAARLAVYGVQRMGPRALVRFDQRVAALREGLRIEELGAIGDEAWRRRETEGAPTELRSARRGLRLELPEGWQPTPTDDPRTWLQLSREGASLFLRARSVAPWFDLDAELARRAPEGAPSPSLLSLADHRALSVEREGVDWSAHLCVGGNHLELRIEPWTEALRPDLRQIVRSLRLERHDADPSRRVDDPRLRYRPWRELFDGATLTGWKETDFGGGAEVVVEDGRMLLDIGEPMTGVSFTGEVPRVNYELEVVATRVHGTDFFCGLTFPVGEQHLSFIAGGWGGSLVGVSSLDGQDASENETRQYHRFDAGLPYRFRLRVRGDRLQGWLDGTPILDVALEGRELSLRREVLVSAPLGIASFITLSAISELRLRSFEE